MKLKDHRFILHNNKQAYTKDLESARLVGTLLQYIRPEFAGCKFHTENKLVLKEVVCLLFEAQDNRPIFHVEGTELPLCWNNPRDWNIDFIKYEWGHLWSRNQSPDKYHSIQNIALYSARCNRHIQSSMNIEELMVYGGLLAQRISNVLTKRRILFESNKWRELLAKII